MGGVAFSILLGAIGCGGDDGPRMPADGGRPDVGPPDAGPACTEYFWDPAGGQLTTWPDPSLLMDDPTTATGVRLHFDEERFSSFAMMASGYLPVFTEDLSDLDGFGINSEIVFRFNRHFDETMLPQAEATALPSTGLGVVVLEPGPARLVPVTVRTTDEGSTLLIAPLRPLPPQAQVAAFVTRNLTGAARGCLEPSAAMTALLASPDEAHSAALAALGTLGVIGDPSEVIALVAYPTQTVTDESVLVAADIAARDYVLDGTPTCTDETVWIRCEAAFIAQDYRTATTGALDIPPGGPVMPVATYRLPLTAWLPPTGSGPFPVLVFGHGLGSGRDQATRLAQFAAPEGIATVAIDAVQHGHHPTNPEPESGTLTTVLRFFAIGDLATRAIEPLRLREHFRQSTYDKLQLTRLLASGVDLTGDGMIDLDATRLGYLGVSLGGLMGPELMALTGAYGVAVLVVPGGRVSAIISDSATFGALIVALRPRGVTEGDVKRFFPVLQTLLDRGDAASYAPHILEDRFAAAGEPSDVLLGIVLDDDTVPNIANYALARAFGPEMTIIPPVLRPEPGLVAGPPAPVSGNLASGGTAGVLQFDVIFEDDGTTISQATHSNVGDSGVGARAWFEFIQTHWDTGTAVIVDPYEDTMLPHGRGAGEDCLFDRECRTSGCDDVTNECAM